MKTIQNFKEIRRSEKAVLISAHIEETGKEETFWIPLSKMQTENNSIVVPVEFWESKLEELRNPKEEMITVTSSVYEKGEKATKLIVEVLFNENVQQIYLYIPNKKIIDLQLDKDEEENRIYNVMMEKWLWESTYQSAIQRQLEFWNREEEKFTAKDFKLLSKLT